MPVFESPYAPPRWLRHGHVQTMWPVLFRKVPPLSAARVRLDTCDGDFVDIEWLRAGPQRGGRRAVVLSHGLEGNTGRKYMRGMASCLVNEGWDVVGRNLRGCSDELPRTMGGYHMGETNDLHTVTQWCVDQGYETLVLVGFSMGGSQTLKYIGEMPQRVPREVRAGVGISVPCDLVGASLRLSQWECAVYMAYFMRTMHGKMRRMAAVFPDFPSIRRLACIRTFDVFDERFTAPINGFTSALDYWTRCSCGQFLPNIAVPVLLLNAVDDPFMTPSCYPRAEAVRNPLLTLELCRYGGHVGFVAPGPRYYSEARVVRWLEERFDPAYAG